MKLFTLIVVAAATFSAVGASDLSALEAATPPCALQCMGIALKESGCAITNQTCLCTDPVLTSTMTSCVNTHCTIRQALTTKNVTSTACHVPIRDRTNISYLLGICGGAIATATYLLRMISKSPYLAGQLGWDDLAMSVTMVFVIPLSVLSVILSNLGLGRDIWTVPFDHITDMLHIYFFSEWIYICCLPLTKISILLFYLRIFPRRGFRIAAYIVIAFNAAYLITFVLITIFQCTPIDGAWLRWDGTHSYTCNNENAQSWAAAILNMILDIVTMVLPLPELYRLNLSVRKKISVMAMFCLGIFVTLVSIVRLHSLIQFANSKNITWDYVDVGYWSVIEVDVGVICACLPSIRSLLSRCLPTIFGDTRKGISSKLSTSRSFPTGSRPDESIWPNSNGYQVNVVPLADLDNSSETHLAHRY